MTVFPPVWILAALLILTTGCDQATPASSSAPENPAPKFFAETDLPHEDPGPEAAPLPTPKARPRSQLPQNTLTFVAYNVKNYLTMPRGNADQPKPEREIKALLHMLADVKPDILGLCEIGTKADLLDLQSRLKKAGIDLPHAELCDGPDAVRNLALLSKFPIHDVNHQTTLSYRMSGRIFPFHRGVLDVTVEPVPGYKLRLLGTHLKSKREVEEGDQNEMRRNEGALLRQHVEKIMRENPESNLLVYGDLNDTKQTDVFKVIRGPEGRRDHLFDLWLRDRFGFTWTHYWITADIYSRIDFILYSKALAPEILKRDSYIHHAPEWFTASDHRPLVVRIQPENSPAKK